MHWNAMNIQRCAFCTSIAAPDQRPMIGLQAETELWRDEPGPQRLNHQTGNFLFILLLFFVSDYGSLTKK